MSRTVILLHGFTGSVESWDEIMGLLPAGVRGIALPILGHHPSVLTTERPTFEGEVDRLAARIQDAARGRVELLGYSMGGRIALGLLARHPSLFSRAWVIGANPGVSSPEERSARAWQEAGWIEILEKQGMPAFADFWRGQPLFDSQRILPQAVRDLQDRLRRRHDPKALALSLRATGLAAMPDLRGALRQLTHPICFMAGARDERFAALARSMAATAPAGRASIVEECGHNVVLEQPRAVVAALKEADT